ILIMPIIQARLVTFPFVFFQIYLVAAFAIMNAYDFSGANTTLCMTKADRLLKYSLWPFATIERYVQSKTGNSRLALAGGYAVFIIVAFLVLPLAVLGFVNEIALEWILIASAIYLLISAEEWCKGF